VTDSAVTATAPYATVTGADAVHPAAVRQLFETLEVAAPGGARPPAGFVPLSLYLTFALPAWREPGEELPEARLPPLPYHQVTRRYGDRAMATSVEVTAGVPLRLGDRITSHWRLRGVTEKVTRLGPGTALDFATDFVNDAGESVAVETATLLVFAPGNGGSDGSRAASAAPLPFPAAPAGGPLAPGAPAVGQRLRDVRLRMTLQRLVMIAAANRDFAPIHHDPVAAAEIGAPAPVVNSMYLLTLAERAVWDTVGFGARITRLGPLRMLRPTPARSTVVCTGWVTAVEAGPAGVLVRADLALGVEGAGLTARCGVEFLLPG
jgi:acyl dehydratase